MSKRSLLVAVLLLSSPLVLIAEEHQVTVKNFVFEPADLQIQVGDTVTWTNEGGLHNVTSTGLFRCANGCDGEGGNGDPASNAWSFSLTFNSEQDIDYFCEVHQGLGMVGSITVVSSPTLSLSVTGTCPGEGMITVMGGTPGGRAAVIWAPEPGSSPVPAGSCAGTPTGLANPKLLAVLDLDGTGAASVSGTLPAGACGVSLQALDLGDCSLSNVDQVPGGP